MIRPAPPRYCPRCDATFPVGAATCPDDGRALVDDLRGELIAARYRVTRLIGLGGMGGVVWEATQLPLERPVALKVVSARDDAEVRRFDRGARIMGRMAHPHITAVHDYGQLPGGAWFLAMERLRGVTLDRLLERGPLDLPRALKVVRQLLRALEHVHGRGVIHRDIKPPNVFISVGDEADLAVKLLDFGIAKRVDDEAAAVDSAARITFEDQICGTPEYMAPEQVLAQPLDARADVYAVGVTLYRMLTGGLPFTSEVRRELYYAKTRTDPPTLAAAAPTTLFPRALEAVIAQALARAPADRFASARAMRDAVRDVQATTR